MVLVRAAKEQDASAIAHVHVQNWLTTYAGIVPDDYLASLNEAERVLVWRDWLTRDIQVYVAEQDGEVVGFVSGARYVSRCRDTMLSCLQSICSIGPQGRGLGTALLRKLAESLGAKGFKAMTVWVLERNAAIHFYEKPGAALVNAKEIEIGGVLGVPSESPWVSQSTLCFVRRRIAGQLDASSCILDFSSLFYFF
jgi:L-amino acid N-acyltransferase YncA